jgi:hypothetical protein
VKDRLTQARDAYDRARRHAEQCRQELARFDAGAADPWNQRARDRLVRDLRRAEEDAGWAEIALADASSPMEVSLQ